MQQLLFCLLLSNIVLSQIKDYDTLATAGPKTITVKDFIDRYEFTIWRGKERKTQVDKYKLEFLYSMIAEKLLALEAEKIGLDKNPEIEKAIKQTERLLILDALYRQEIKSKISVSEEEVLKALPKFNTEVELHYIIARTKKEADSIWEKLRLGEEFDSMMVKLGQKGNIEKLRWGEMYEPIEDVVYNYLAVGEIYQPIQVDSIWYIIKLANKTSKFGLSPDEIESAKSQVRKIISERKEKKRYEEFLNEFRKGKTLNVDGHLLKLLYEEIKTLIEKKKEARTKQKEPIYPIALNQDDYDQIKFDLKEHLHKYFLKAENFNRNLEYVIDQISYKGFVIHSEKQSISGTLNNILKTIINEEFLAFEAYRRGLDKSPDVVKDLQMWRDAYLAYAMKKNFIDSLNPPRKITTGELLKSFSPEKDVWEINIVEILVDKLQLADSLMKLIKNGYDMSELARKFSKRKWTAEKGGVTGYILSTQLGEVGKIASALEIGELYGPLYTDDGYLILKLLDKRKPKDTISVINYDSFYVAFNRYIGTLADKYGVSIRPELLKKIEVTYINTIVIRFLGFNNRMLAVPLLDKNADWILFMKRKDIPFP